MITISDLISALMIMGGAGFMLGAAAGITPQTGRVVFGVCFVIGVVIKYWMPAP